MKRDLELIRKILINVERFSEEGSYDLDIPGYSKAEIIYNSELLIGEGYIKGDLKTYLDGSKSLYLESLTWGGHDLLDSIRNESVWIKLKRTIEDSTGSVALETLKALGTKLTANYLEQKLGL